MFENIGNTIKVMAKVFWWFGTITIAGILFMWPIAFILYGFGELVENSSMTTYMLAKQDQKAKTEQKDELPKI